MRNPVGAIESGVRACSWLSRQSIACVWSVLRIRDPQKAFGRNDAAGRLLFAAWQTYALMHGASFLLLGFLIMELVWAVWQLWPVRKAETTDL